MAIYRAFNDEKGNPEEHYYSEEAATAAYFADVRMGWEVQVNRKWVNWAPSVTREEYEAARRQRQRDEMAEWLRSNGKMPAPEPDSPA